VRKQIYSLTDNSNKSPKEILISLVKRLSPGDSYTILTLNHVIDLLDIYKFASRRSRASQFMKSSYGSIKNILSANSQYQKDIKLEIDNDIDKCIYDVVPDEEDIERIFS